MLKAKSKDDDRELVKGRRHAVVILVDGVLIGILTGFIGAGGGFIIVPALMGFMNFSLREAIATSLWVIILKSLVGVASDICHQRFF